MTKNSVSLRNSVTLPHMIVVFDTYDDISSIFFFSFFQNSDFLVRGGGGGCLSLSISQ